MLSHPSSHPQAQSTLSSHCGAEVLCLARPSPCRAASSGAETAGTSEATRGWPTLDIAWSMSNLDERGKADTDVSLLQRRQRPAVSRATVDPPWSPGHCLGPSHTAHRAAPVHEGRQQGPGGLILVWKRENTPGRKEHRARRPYLG